jgi:hypothetical protein
MKTIFKVFGLKEEDILRGSWLGSDGIRTESELAVTRHHLIDCDSEIEAFEFLLNKDAKTEQFEHGFEIIKAIQI